MEFLIAEQQKLETVLYYLFISIFCRSHKFRTLLSHLFLQLHTKSENGIPKKARVLEWVVTNPLWDLEFVQKQWCLAKPILAVRQLYMSHCKKENGCFNLALFISVASQCCNQRMFRHYFDPVSSIVETGCSRRQPNTY